ncbi:MAG: response regulator [Candidatus Nitrosotenuis sp.]|uniref:response regulator n=1 Tax=Candidatus Nitrosotenuis uzonensis TaxID=1407055 RepID=UPI000693CD77|nr:response regulator [Candidatus Nitrosotenuis uzonensis]
MRILIAEDNQFTASQYERILRKYGHEVIVTRDGQECLKKYKESLGRTEFDSIDKSPFDVVVLDQSMPKKNGSEVATEILSVRPAQKIVFASAYALSANKVSESLEERVEYLQKPFSLNALVSKIEAA